MKKKNKFSPTQREDILQDFRETSFDLLVIGGGITGAGIALDAAARGLKVALIEKGDFASGTSSKSTKLIHGGLRYLKQFDFWLVKEVGTERAIVHKLAPHLVLPEKMLLPLIENGSYGKWLTSIGLKVYDILAQVTGDDQRQMLDKKEARKLEPLLPKKILKGAGYYAEYRTDDARLTIELIKTGRSHGAQSLNYVEAKDFLYQEEKIIGVKAKDLVSQQEISIKARQVINAAGPWVDELRGINKSRQGKRLHLTKGVHLVVPFEKLPVQQSVYFDVPDGRMMFAIPRGKVTYIGTTDTDYSGDKNDVRTDPADAIYLLAAVNNMFPSIELQMEDIESSWAGLRPLIHEEGKSASELSRKDEIFTSSSGLISIAGGKLTGYRKMAERSVDRVTKKLEEDLGRAYPKCSTDEIPLCGNDFVNFKAVQKYIKEIEKRLKKEGLTPYHAWHLVTTYGKQTEIILDLYQGKKDGEAEKRLILAEVQFGLDYEMVTSPLDFFIRRSGRLYFDIQSIRTYLPAVLELFEKRVTQEQTLLQQWETEMQEEIEKHGNFLIPSE